MFVAAVMAAAHTASAQQTTGTPGSPNATTTVDGKYVRLRLPRRRINMNVKDSTPYATDVVPPKGRPTCC